MVCGDLALTSTCLLDGTVTAEVADKVTERGFERLISLRLRQSAGLGTEEKSFPPFFIERKGAEHPAKRITAFLHRRC